MEYFTALQLQFDCEAETDIALSPFPGSAFRGVLFRSLLDQFCLNPTHKDCPTCPLNNGTCPIGTLAATVDLESSRGVEVVRPFTIEPPLDLDGKVKAGDKFSFGITLLGNTRQMYPYMVLGAVRAGRAGVGNKRVSPGRFRVSQVAAVNSLAGAQQTVFRADSGVVSPPKLIVTDPEVRQAAASSPHDYLRIHLLTPMRLVVDGQLVRRLTFVAFARCLLRRLTDLYAHWCGQRLDLPFSALLENAVRVEVAADDTYWVDVGSYSGRTGRTTPVGGLVGEIRFVGDVGPLMPYVIWGSLVHVGKDCTKGDGWYEVTQ